MNKLKVIGKNILTSSIFLLIAIFFFSVLSYFNILNGKVLSIVEIIIIFIAILIGAYKQGKFSNKRGYLEGLKIGAVYLLLFIVINAIFYKLFHLKNIIYYTLILIISAFGGMIGISRKKNNS